MPQIGKSLLVELVSDCRGRDAAAALRPEKQERTPRSHGRFYFPGSVEHDDGGAFRRIPTERNFGWRMTADHLIGLRCNPPSPIIDPELPI